MGGSRRSGKRESGHSVRSTPNGASSFSAPWTTALIRGSASTSRPIRRRWSGRVRSSSTRSLRQLRLANRLFRVAYDPLSDEQREIRDLVRTLARERVGPRAAEIDKKGEFPWDMVELFKEHELFGLPFEEQYGGTGTGALMVLVAIEELSKVCATTARIMAVQELGSLGIKLAGTEEQKQRFLPSLAGVDWLAAYALTV